MQGNKNDWSKFGLRALKETLRKYRLQETIEVNNEPFRTKIKFRSKDKNKVEIWETETTVGRLGSLTYVYLPEYFLLKINMGLSNDNTNGSLRVYWW